MNLRDLRLCTGILLLFLTLLVVPVAADLASTPWPKFMHDNNNTGRSPYIGSQTNTVKWTYPTGGQISYSSASISLDGTIYIGSTDGNFYAINPDGTKRWSYAAGAVHSTAAIGSDGTIYIGSDSGLFALNSDGTKKWSYTTGAVYGSPTIGSDGIIYFGSNDFNLYAINPDGTKKWSYTTGGSIYGGSPAIGIDGTVYFGSNDKKIYALNSDGTFKWSYTTGGKTYSSPSIGMDGTVYFGSNDKKVYALNSDGTFKWSYITGGNLYGSPAIGTDGTLYFGTYNDKKVYALNPDGSFKWSYTATGSVAYSQTTAVIGADGTIYIAAYGDNKVYALKPDGTLKWSYAAGDKNVNTPSIGPDGTVYVGSYDKKLYAFAGVLDYSVDTTSGGSPLAVRFTPTTSLSVTSWNWSFGDGTYSEEQTPLHTYSSVGSYTVKLTVTNSDDTVYYHILPDYIKIYSPPAAGFTADVTSGISPLTVRFTDQSANVPTSWTWDFGDSDSTNATKQNPVHTYAAAGTYTVSLIATNAGGSNTAQKIGHITVSPPPDKPPVVSFNATPRISTTAPLTVQFHDTSTLSPTSWLWDFGDGDSTNATKQNPVHTYASAGTYRVNLTATNAVGPSTASRPGFITFVTPGLIPAQNNVNLYVANDEGIKYEALEENGVNADGAYSYIPNTYFLHMTGGLNAFGMTDENNADIIRTRNQSGTLWAWFAGGQATMPDGVLMLAINGTIPDDFAVHIRSSGYNWTPGGPGTYNAGTPTEYNYVEGAINQTFTKSDFIYGPQIWRPCSEGDYPIYSRQDMSNTADTFRIMFIDLYAGSPKGLPNSRIKVEYSFTNLTSFAAFDVYGWYGTSNHGTGIIMTNSNTMEWTVIGIPAAPVAAFTSSTNTSDILSPVQFTDTSANVPQSWLWEFGDGATSTEQNPAHTYAAPGTYTVNLTVTNYKGTDKISKTGHITKSIPPVPVAGFTVNATSGTSPCPIQFTDQSTGIVFSHTWDFGDGSTSTEQNPVHWFAPGTYTVNLTVTNSGGSNSTQKSGIVTISSNGRTNQFVNPGFETGDLTGWTASGTEISPSYVHSGNYAMHSLGGNMEQHIDLTGASNISFWAYKPSNSAASDTYFSVIVDGQNIGSFPTTCIYTWMQYTLPISGYKGIHTVTISHGGIAPSIYTTYLDDFCAGSGTTCSGSGASTKPPTASFTATPVNGAAPLAVTFTDTSTGSPTGWLWDFGDGSTSKEQNPSHKYTKLGTYDVKLTATNADGSNTMTRTGLVYVAASAGPISDYNKTYIRAANHDGIRWDSNSNGTYYVQAGSGGLSAIHVSTDPAVSAGQVTVTNSQAGTIYVTASGTNSYQDEIVLLLAANGTLPDNFAARIKTSGYTWTPVSGKAPSSGYTYQSPALDQTFTKNDFFYGPQNWKPTQGDPAYPLYAGQDMNSSAEQYQLMFIDTRAGLLSGSSLTNKGAVKIEYNFTNLPDNAHFNVYGWKTKDGMGWTNDLASGYTVISPLVVIPPVADFRANQTEGLAPFNARFKDESLNRPTSWYWDFGDGNTSYKQNPSFTYTTAGDYTVKLTATNSKGSDTKIRTAYINVTAPVTTTSPLAFTGVTAGTTGSSQTVALNATNSTTVGNVVTVTNVSSTWDHLAITLDAAPVTDNGNLTGTVSSVLAVAQPVTVPLESLGNPNITLTLNLAQLPGSTASIASTITSDPDDSAQSSFTAAATTDGKSIAATAYTVNFVKTGIANADKNGIIRSANVTMTVNHTWVANNGGTDSIRIFHRSDDGTTTILVPTYDGADAFGNDIFTAYSPTGLSTFVLAAIASLPATDRSTTTYYGGSIVSTYSTIAAPTAAATTATPATTTPTPTPTLTATPVPTQTEKLKIRITPWPTPAALAASQDGASGAATGPATPGSSGWWKNPWLLTAEAIAAIAILTTSIAAYLRRRRRRRDPLRWEYK